MTGICFEFVPQGFAGGKLGLQCDDGPRKMWKFNRNVARGALLLPAYWPEFSLSQALHYAIGLEVFTGAKHASPMPLNLLICEAQKLLYSQSSLS